MFRLGGFSMEFYQALYFPKNQIYVSMPSLL